MLKEGVFLQRYFVYPDQWQESSVRILGDDAAHIAKVMRMRSGDQVILCDNLGRTVLAELVEIDSSLVKARILDDSLPSSEPACQLTLVQGLPKGDKLEYILQKGTEVGVARFQLIDTERCIVQIEPSKAGRKLERWRKIAKEAAEQSHRTKIPEIEVPLSFSNWLETAASFDLVLVCYEGKGLSGIRQALDAILEQRKHETGGDLSNPLSVAVCIGPEGGFSISEINLAEASGARIVTLGPRILRTETAGLIAAACIFYHLGEMGGS